MSEKVEKRSVEEIEKSIKELIEERDKIKKTERELLESQKKDRIHELNVLKEDYNTFINEGLEDLKKIREEFDNETSNLKKEYEEDLKELNDLYEGKLQERKDKILEEAAVKANEYQDAFEKFKEDYKSTRDDYFRYEGKKYINGELVEDKVINSEEEYNKYKKETNASNDRLSRSIRDFIKFLGE